jgi:hypothetical protein
MCTVPVSSRCTEAASAPTRIDTPVFSRASVTRSPANGSAVGRTPSRASTVTAEPRPEYAVAISMATTPPPMMASRAGARSAAAASRLVHGAAAAIPVMSGTIALVPVAMTTACRAVSVTGAPSPSLVTSTVRVSLMRPCPR